MIPPQTVTHVELPDALVRLLPYDENQELADFALEAWEEAQILVPWWVHDAELWRQILEAMSGERTQFEFWLTVLGEYRKQDGKIEENWWDASRIRQPHGETALTMSR